MNCESIASFDPRLYFEFYRGEKKFSWGTLFWMFLHHIESQDSSKILNVQFLEYLSVFIPCGTCKNNSLLHLKEMKNLMFDERDTLKIFEQKVSTTVANALSDEMRDKEFTPRFKQTCLTFSFDKPCLSVYKTISENNDIKFLIKYTTYNHSSYEIHMFLQKDNLKTIVSHITSKIVENEDTSVKLLSINSGRCYSKRDKYLNLKQHFKDVRDAFTKIILCSTKCQNLKINHICGTLEYFLRLIYQEDRKEEQDIHKKIQFINEQHKVTDLFDYKFMVNNNDRTFSHGMIIGCSRH